MTKRNDYLLSINIPTYKRLNEYSRLIDSIYFELAQLNEAERLRIIVRIFENPSPLSTRKYLMLSQIKELGVTVKWHQNPTNIGGDANIEQAYSSSQDCIYQWIIGDDEFLERNSLSCILNLLNGNNDIGIVILRDTTYPVNRSLLNKRCWESYYAFAKDCSIYQPHLLLAHTLISSNIIRAGLFDATVSNHYRNTIRKRIECPFSFAHMMGIISTLSKWDNLSTILLDQPLINTTLRAKSLDPTVNHEIYIQRVYTNYILWLSHEFGLNHVAILSSIRLRLPCKWLSTIPRKLYHVLRQLLYSILKYLTTSFRVICH